MDDQAANAKTSESVGQVSGIVTNNLQFLYFLYFEQKGTRSSAKFDKLIITYFIGRSYRVLISQHPYRLYEESQKNRNRILPCVTML